MTHGEQLAVLELQVVTGRLLAAAATTTAVLA